VLEDIKEEIIDKKSKRKVCEETERGLLWDLSSIDLNKTEMVPTEKDKNQTNTFEDHN
jgi:hypothetical protein